MPLDLKNIILLLVSTATYRRDEEIGIKHWSGFFFLEKWGRRAISSYFKNGKVTVLVKDG